MPRAASTPLVADSGVHAACYGDVHANRFVNVKAHDVQTATRVYARVLLNSAERLLRVRCGTL